MLERISDPGRAQFGKMLDPELFKSVKAAGGFDFPPLPTPLAVVDTEALLEALDSGKIGAH